MALDIFPDPYAYPLDGEFAETDDEPPAAAKVPDKGDVDFDFGTALWKPVVRRKRLASPYTWTDWKRLGKVIEASRVRLGMTRDAFAYSIGSSNKSITRIESGRVFSNPVSAPRGDYNSDVYVLKRAAFIEMTLEWEAGAVTAILDDPGRIAEPGASVKVRTHEDICHRADERVPGVEYL